MKRSAMIYLLGAGSFIAKHLYVMLKREGFDEQVVLVGHLDLSPLATATDADVLVNCCGTNRADKEEEFDEGNFNLVRTILVMLRMHPHFVHLSSQMVAGFKGRETEHLENGQRWFIQSKLRGERHLRENYPARRLCIVRPSNVYGATCQPFRNSLLVTMVHDKVHQRSDTLRLNSNSVRNFVSADALCSQMMDLIKNRSPGLFSVLSTNTLSLADVAQRLHGGKLPEHIIVESGAPSVVQSGTEACTTIVTSECFATKIAELEADVRAIHALASRLEIRNVTSLKQPRGDMVEVSSLHSRRLYKITINPHEERGKHYHMEQTEEFFTNRGRVTYVFSLVSNPRAFVVHHSVANDVLHVAPGIVHTLYNDFGSSDVPEVIVSSTQPFLAGTTPDTYYVDTS